LFIGRWKRFGKYDWRNSKMIKGIYTQLLLSHQMGEIMTIGDTNKLAII
jgi:hypothetical protein